MDQFGSSSWRPSDDAFTALCGIRDAVAGIPGVVPAVITQALLYALMHPCSGPGVQRIILMEDGPPPKAEDVFSEGG